MGGYVRLPSAGRSSASRASWLGCLPSEPHKTALSIATTQGKVLTFVILVKVFTDGMFTQCFGPNSNLSFGLFLAVTVRSSDGPFD